MLKKLLTIRYNGYHLRRIFSPACLIAANGISKANIAVSLDTADHVHIKQMKANLVVDRAADGTFPMQFYFGYNKFDFLQKQGYDLEKQVDLGWGPLKYINRFAVLPVFHFLEQFNWSYGLIILALTVILKNCVIAAYLQVVFVHG